MILAFFRCVENFHTLFLKINSLIKQTPFFGIDLNIVANRVLFYAHYCISVPKSSKFRATLSSKHYWLRLVIHSFTTFLYNWQEGSIDYFVSNRSLRYLKTEVIGYTIIAVSVQQIA